MNCREGICLLSIVLVVFFVIVPTVSAAVLFVPSEYRTIQAAIDVASPGDVVSVGAGTFREALVLTEGVTLLGAGRTRTSIDAEADAVAIKAAPGCRICGLSIVEGIIGIDCNGADAVIEDNYIQSRYLGIRTRNCSPQIFNNTIEAVYMCIVTEDSGAPIIHNNHLTGRYVGLWAENTSPLVHNNRIANFEHGVYTIGSNGYILNNKVINSLYDGIVITRASSCVLSNNAIVGHYERGVSVFNSSPLLQYNIISENESGLFCQDASPTLAHNCIASNREVDYDGVSASATDIPSDPLLAGTGIVSSITGVNYDTLVCTDARWETNSLVGLDLVPDTSAMYIIYGGQFRTFEVLSNTRTSITVAVDTTEAAPKTLYKCGSEENYTKPGDRFFVDDVSLQTRAAGWPADSPCLGQDVGIYSGGFAGEAGPLKAPVVALRSLKQVYKADETVNILADLTNDQQRSIDVDLHIIIFIDGSPVFYSYPHWTTSFDPVPYHLNARHSETLAVLVIAAAAIPQGDFKALAAFTKRETFEIISPISELWFSTSGR